MIQTVALKGSQGGVPPLSWLGPAPGVGGGCPPAAPNHRRNDHSHTEQPAAAPLPAPALGAGACPSAGAASRGGRKLPQPCVLVRRWPGNFSELE